VFYVLLNKDVDKTLSLSPFECTVVL